MNKPAGLLVVAERPKTRRNIDYPMLGTKSFEKLKEWLVAAKILDKADDVSYSGYGMTVLGVVAIVNASTSNKGKPSIEDIEQITDGIEGAAVVLTLGKLAEETVLEILNEHRRLHIPTVVSVPHPSGLNRKLNSKEAKQDVERKLLYARRLLEIAL